MAYQLAKDGWDVWITNNSAVQYSQEHDTWTPYDKEYWAMDWRKYALYDFPAAVAEIRKRNGDKKVTYVGHSQGTTQMLAGMGLIPEWYDENVSSAVLMGPCDCPSQQYFLAYDKENWDFMLDNQIYAFSNTAGYDWEEKKQLIIDEGPQSLVSVLNMFDGLPNSPIQAVAAYAQTSKIGRFQQYTDDFLTEENPKSPIMDYGLVKKMKVSMFVGLFDNTCPVTRAQEIYENLGGEKTVYKWIVQPMDGHGTWGFVSNPWFMDQLTDSLSVNADI